MLGRHGRRVVLKSAPSRIGLSVGRYQLGRCQPKRNRSTKPPNIPSIERPESNELRPCAMHQRVAVLGRVLPLCRRGRFSRTGEVVPVQESELSFQPLSMTQAQMPITSDVPALRRCGLESSARQVTILLVSNRPSTGGNPRQQKQRSSGLGAAAEMSLAVGRSGLVGLRQGLAILRLAERADCRRIIEQEDQAF